MDSYTSLLREVHDQNMHLSHFLALKASFGAVLMLKDYYCMIVSCTCSTRHQTKLTKRSQI